MVKFSYQNVKHITLICQHDKLPLVRWYVHSGISPIVSVRILFIFPLFVSNLSLDYLKKESTIMFKFSQYLCLIWGIAVVKLFSLITQPWRHLGAILWIHVIIHIFITIHPKSTIFNAHKLQAICQHTGLFISGLYQIRARARASKFRNAQNHL